MVSGFLTFVAGAYLSEAGGTERTTAAGLLGLILGAFLGVSGLAVFVAVMAAKIPS